jgi:diguanylate cyclase (GGDEF)-like protein
MAFRDALTGVKNFRYLEEALVRELARSQRDGQPVSLVLFDIDHFKRINDEYGHQRGDIALRRIAQTIRRTSRKHDIVARYGGEEFALVLPETNAAGAKLKAEACRTTIERLAIRAEGVVIRATISLGVAVYNPLRPIPKDQLIQAADRALYKSKKDGRNRVTVWK